MVLGKRLDFHPSGVILDVLGVKGSPAKVMLLWDVFLFPALFRGRHTGFTLTACELLSVGKSSQRAAILWAGR